MILIGDRSLFRNRTLTILALIVLSLVLPLNTQAQEDSKNSEIWRIKLLLTPNLTFTTTKFVHSYKPLVNLGLSLYFERINPSRIYFFSYGLTLDKNTIKRSNLVDNREVVDENGTIDETKIRYFDAKFSYSYIAASVAFNYKILNKETFFLALTTGLSAKYYWRYKTQYNLHSGKLTSILNPSDLIEDDPPIVAIANLGLWYSYSLSEQWHLQLGTNYAQDLYTLSISSPIFSKIEVHLGLIRTITRPSN